jgi:hypothetical protein
VIYLYVDIDIILVINIFLGVVKLQLSLSTMKNCQATVNNATVYAI